MSLAPLTAEGTMKMPGVRAFTYVLSCLLMLLIQRHATAQDYPVNPVRLVVPFPAGGPADALGRILGEKLSQRWGQPVIIENRSGRAETSGPPPLLAQTPTVTRCCSTRRAT